MPTPFASAGPRTPRNGELYPAARLRTGLGAPEPNRPDIPPAAFPSAKAPSPTTRGELSGSAANAFGPCQGNFVAGDGASEGGRCKRARAQDVTLESDDVTGVADVDDEFVFVFSR